MRGVKHLVKPILQARWALMPALREFRVFGLGGNGRKASCGMKPVFHRNRLAHSSVTLLSHIALVESEYSSATVERPVVDRNASSESAPAVGSLLA